jgi:hypothetical protein
MHADRSGPFDREIFYVFLFNTAYDEQRQQQLSGSFHHANDETPAGAARRLQQTTKTFWHFLLRWLAISTV